MKPKKHIIIIGALPESLINFRGELIKALTNLASVTAMASDNNSKVINTLDQWSVKFQAFPIKRNGLNPITDFKTWLALRKTFIEIKPKVILAYTIKPVIWGGVASKVLPNSKFYALITGLGFAFQGGSLVRDLLANVVIQLYRSSLKNAEKVIFQNPDNLQVFVSRNIIPKEKCALVNGSGVDIDHFGFSELPDNKKGTVFLSIGRLLGEKGFREYAEAARIVKESYPETVFRLQGSTDPSPDGLSLTEIEEWQNKGLIEYLEPSDDIRPSIQSCHIYVLPSYHEGMPRTVLEAMAIGRPILTTDVPGCRETVIDGENGYLVPKENVEALAQRMIWFINNRDEWQRMVEKSRALAEEKYDVHKVNAKLIEIMGL